MLMRSSLTPDPQFGWMTPSPPPFFKKIRKKYFSDKFKKITIFEHFWEKIETETFWTFFFKFPQTSNGFLGTFLDISEPWTTPIQFVILFCNIGQGFPSLQIFWNVFDFFFTFFYFFFFTSCMMPAHYLRLPGLWHNIYLSRGRISLGHTFCKDFACCIRKLQN